MNRDRAIFINGTTTLAAAASMTIVSYFWRRASASEYALDRIGGLLKGLSIMALVIVLMLRPDSLLAQSSNDRTWSVNIGPNAKNFGLAGITKDFLVNNHFSLFVTGGLGTTLIGGGGAYYVTSFHESSFVLSANAGLIGAYANASYQWRVGRRGFVTTGVSYGSYYLQYKGFQPVVAFELRF